MSIKEDLQATPERGRKITGYELMALERFAEDTRHMILFDVLTWDCPVGDKGERVRIFLTDEGYTKALSVPIYYTGAKRDFGNMQKKKPQI